MGEHSYVEVTSVFFAATCPHLEERVHEVLHLLGIRHTSPEEARLLLVDEPSLRSRKDLMAAVRAAIGDRDRIVAVYTGEADQHYRTECALRDYHAVSLEERSALAEHALEVCDRVEQREALLARAERICVELGAGLATT